VLGASVSDATTGANSLLTVGASVGQVTAGGAADTAGLKTGDVITNVGVRSAGPDATVNITYTRGTASNTVAVTLGSATAN